jgi:acetylornithine deacetylase
MNPAPVPAVKDMLAALVAIPSMSSANPRWDQSNRGVVDALGDWLDALGFAVERMPIADRPGKFNLIATLGEGCGGLVFAGHSDTVPFDEGAWSGDPHRLRERDGRWYGLGTCDMKGFFPLALEAARGLRGEALRAPLVVVATADEESSMCGARALTGTARRLGRHAVIGEPTGMKPVRAHKGVMIECIRVYGRSGHASDPALGRNALEGMHGVIAALLAWRERAGLAHRDPGFSVPTPTLNLGCIQGGDNPNRICAQCELHLDVRVLPHMDFGSVHAEIETCVAEALAGTGLGHEVCQLIEPVPAHAVAAAAPIVAAVERLTGAAAASVAFASEAPFLAAMGLDTVLLGPGDIGCAHQPDEYLEIGRVAPGVRILRALIRRFCTEQSDG